MKSDSAQEASTTTGSDDASQDHGNSLETVPDSGASPRPRWLTHTLEAFGQDVLLLALERMALPQRELYSISQAATQHIHMTRTNTDSQADSALVVRADDAAPHARPLRPDRSTSDRRLADEKGDLEPARFAQVPHGRQQRMLVTILFTDIVGSTPKVQELGDEKWSSLLERHRAIVRRQLLLLAGREIEVPGDGFLAIFATATSAAKCARAIRAALRPIGLEIRAGLHAGECEVTAGRLIGIAVHIAARVVRIAEAGQILVSSTVRDLALGSGLSFSAGVNHTLKGLTDNWQLFELNEAESKSKRSLHSKGPTSFGLQQSLN